MKLQRDRFQVKESAGSGDDGEDIACLSQIALGDRAAFERLYRRYYDRLFRFVLRVTGRMNLVEDVINDTMIVIWRKAGDYRAAARASTWIFGIAYRKGLKALSRELRAPEVMDELPELEQPPSDALDREGLHSAIRQAVMRLPPEHRAVVDLTFFFNRSYEEAAQILDVPVGTVKSRMFHARAKLRPLLTQLLGD
ncbi:MAG TPA: sigma-70 family RNA polymerase sigma factor [Rudaea sp.]|jgi:RNA polymerase sigma-70 factor (ECF subfamily)